MATSPRNSRLKITPAMNEWMFCILKGMPEIEKTRHTINMKDPQILFEIEFLTSLLERKNSNISEKQRNTYDNISAKYKTLLPDDAKRICADNKREQERDRKFFGAKTVDITRWTKS